MAGEFGLVLAPWDLAKGGAELLERVAGEAGLEHVTVPAVTGEHVAFRLALQPDSPAFHTEGGWQFPAQTKLYAAAPVRPRTARWLATRDPLAAVREQTRRLGLRLVLRVDLPAVRTLVEQAPQMRARSAWGDLPGFAPCPNSPDFRELLVAVLNDVARYEPDAIELAALRLEPWVPSPPPRGLSHWLPVTRSAGMCFCAACRQIATLAGVDADQVAHTARETALGWATATALPEQTGVRALSEPEGQYRAARVAALENWLARLAEAHASRVMYLIDGLQAAPVDEPVSAPAPPPWRTLCGVSAERMAAFLSNPTADATDVFRSAATLERAYDGYCLPLWTPTGFRPDGFVQLVKEICESGQPVVEFEGLEEAPAAASTWLKQAVRFARRQ